MLAIVRIGAIHSIVFAGFGAQGARAPDRGQRLARRLHRRRHVSQGAATCALKPIVDEAHREPASRSSASSCTRTAVRTLSRPRVTWEAFLRSATATAATATRWKPTNRRSSSRPPARPPGRNSRSTRTAAIRSTSSAWRAGASALTARRRVVGDVGYRLDRRPQLHRLRAADRRLHDGRLRGRARLPGADAQLARGDRGVRRHRDLHVADGRADADAIRRRHPAGIDYSRLERIVCAGEALNPPAWDWLQNHTLDGRVPVIDHMWQTETGGPVFGNPLGIALLPIKPGSAGHSAAGIEAAVMRAGRHAVRAGRERDHGADAPVPRPDAGAVGRARAIRP